MISKFSSITFQLKYKMDLLFHEVLYMLESLNIGGVSNILLVMALLAFLLIISAFLQATAQQNNSIIKQGSSLTPTSKSMWLSPSGLYAFGFYPESNGFRIGILLAGLSQKMVVWTANRDEPPVSPDATLEFNTDGRLILQVREKNETENILAQYGDEPQVSAFSASMLDSGNFVLYDSNHTIIWQSFDYPTDTLLSGQWLRAGNELVSSFSNSIHSKGIFRLAMQTDGHLVQYPINTPNTAPYSYWASGTAWAGSNVTLNLDNNGHLYLLNSTGYNIKDINTSVIFSTKKMIYLMRIDSDGIFRLYSHGLEPNGTSWSPIWSSSNDLCVPKGVCGLNAYCDSNNDKFGCRCLPGFDFVNPSQWSSGCQRNFSADRCTNKKAAIKYTMGPLENTIWEDNYYDVLTMSDKQDCEKACLEDCNCEAASFKDGECRRLRLPLRFGRRLSSESTIVFIKRVTSAFPRITNGAAPRNTRRVIPTVIMVITISIASVALVLAIFGVLVYKYQIRSYEKISEKWEVGLGDDLGPRRFTFEELVKATNGFEEELGRGSFGTVYKGKTSDSKMGVAIKKLDKVLEENEREFQTEMKVIGRTHHRNLVKLHGYCLDGRSRLLVYEYMSHSLADALFATGKKLCWDERIGFAINVARGILYLHEECETQIIHCDIKPQNILLDGYGNAKISDFGLAKLMRHDQTNTNTGVRGTRGYVAPEWYRNLPVTVKVDVYGFGILLFEVICCRKNVDSSLPEEEVVLEQWVYDCFETRMLSKLVPDEAIDLRKLERMVKVGLWCIQDEPSLRPSMKKIVLMLEGTVDIPRPPSPTSFLSAV